MPKAYDHVMKILDDANGSAKGLSKAERTELRDYLTKTKEKIASIKALARRYGKLLNEYSDVKNGSHSVCENCKEAFCKKAVVFCFAERCTPQARYCFDCCQQNMHVRNVDGMRVYFCDRCAK